MISMSLALSEKSRKEPGCILYSFLEDAGDPGRFVFFEKWQSREALDEHFNQPHFKDFAEKFPGMITGEPLIEAHQVSDTETIA